MQDLAIKLQTARGITCLFSNIPHLIELNQEKELLIQGLRTKNGQLKEAIKTQLSGKREELKLLKMQFTHIKGITFSHTCENCF